MQEINYGTGFPPTVASNLHESPIRIIVGAGKTSQPGWCSLQRSNLDIRCRRQWEKLFSPGSLHSVLCEHVLEHLSFNDAFKAACNVHEFLQPGGYWRIAVPDANHPSRIYYHWNRPNGFGRWVMKSFVYNDGEPTHEVFYALNFLEPMLRFAGFEVHPLEWYDVTLCSH